MVTVPKWSKMIQYSYSFFWAERCWKHFWTLLDMSWPSMTKALLLFGGEANTLSMALSSSHERRRRLQNTWIRIRLRCPRCPTSVPMCHVVQPSASTTISWLFKSSRPRHPPLGEECIHRDRQREALARSDRGPPHCGAAATARRPDGLQHIAAV